MFSYNVNSGGTFINHLLMDVCRSNDVSIAEFRHGKKHPGILHLANHRFVCYTNDADIIYKAAGGGDGPETKITLSRNTTYKIGLVRNPFDWYVGLWGRTCRHQSNVHELYTSSNDIAGFQNWLKHLMDNNNLDTHIPQHLDGLIWVQDEGHPETYKPSLLHYDFGILSYQTFALHFGLDDNMWSDVDDTMGDMDHIVCNHGRDTTSIVNDVVPMLQELGLECSIETYKSYKHDNPKTQLTASPHLPYQDYYNDETKQLVMYKDRFLFQKYGFKFDQSE
jgi:hypothetical protein